MAFVNEDGVSISFECSELIEELKEDMMEFGFNEVVAVWCKEYDGVTIYTNYDFIDELNPIRDTELKEDEYLQEMTIAELLPLLEQQNDSSGIISIVETIR